MNAIVKSKRNTLKFAVNLTKFKVCSRNACPIKNTKSETHIEVKMAKDNKMILNKTEYSMIYWLPVHIILIKLFKHADLGLISVN